MSTRALVILADGFEEIEALTVVDVLRRGHVKVTIAALDFKLVTGAHEIIVKADCLLEELPEHEYNMLILPGGNPGTTNLEKSELVTNHIKRMAAEGTYIAAICAAPRILDHMGLLKHKKATCFPSTKDDIIDAHIMDENVVVDGHYITSKGPGTAMEFAFKLLEILKPEHIEDIKRAMIVA